MHLYKIFSASRYRALIASVKLRIGSPKTAVNGMYKFVRTKSHTVSNFSKLVFERLYTGWIVVVHLCIGFSLWRQKAPQQSAKFRTAFFGRFRTSLRNDSVVNYESIWTLFSKSVRRQDVLCNALNISQIYV